MPQHEEILRETYRLAQENNRLLRKMRRSTMWGRLFTVVFYGALLLAPVWFYLTYLNDSVQHLLQTAQELQGKGQQAQSQLSGLEEMFKQFQSKLQSVAPSQR